ncbi:hypothetical protein AAFF_G00400950 [Aldrovandia affinis]|uniref:Uncharacterized protein n=1 Tax=Aldrovandia affinis TaxID=143900 RepID=A0AAD7SEU6_9TELE|nr:hypothetical protein AAFF_G00400950 [Aldrovandia affinis]
MHLTPTHESVRLAQDSSKLLQISQTCGPEREMGTGCMEDKLEGLRPGDGQTNCKWDILIQATERLDVEVNLEERTQINRSA